MIEERERERERSVPNVYHMPLTTIMNLHLHLLIDIFVQYSSNTTTALLPKTKTGYDIGVSTNAGQLIQNDFNLTDSQRELFVGSLNFFSIFGSMFSHWISDRFGRRRSFQVAAVTFIVGLSIMSASNSYTVLMIGRAILGLAVGFGLAIDPLYIGTLSSYLLLVWSTILPFGRNYHQIVSLTRSLLCCLCDLSLPLTWVYLLVFSQNPRNKNE